MTTIQITAKRWDGGWELWDTTTNECLTQVTKLSQAKNQVIDYLDTIDENTDHTNWEITITPDLGPVTNQIRQSQEATRQAARAQETAALKTRRAVKAVLSQGITMTDCATIMGVSKARVSQLAK